MNELSKEEMWRPHPKILTPMIGSFCGATLFYYVIRRWNKHHRPFFIFGAPCAHELYSNGRSWKEAIGFSADDVKSALSVVGYRATSTNKESVALSDHRPDFDTKGLLLNANHLIVYKRDFLKKITWYELNYILAKKAIALVRSGEWADYIAPITEGMQEIEDKEREGVSIEEAMDISSFSELKLPN